jgi:excisionase family DNA binding protein
LREKEKRTQKMATATKSRGADKLLLSPEEVAEVLGVGPTFARDLIRRGELPSVRMGRLVKVPTVAIERYISRLLEAEQAGTSGETN